MTADERSVRAHTRAAAKYPPGHTRRENHLKAAEKYGGPTYVPYVEGPRTPEIHDLPEPPNVWRTRSGASGASLSEPIATAQGQAGKIERSLKQSFYRPQLTGVSK